MSLEYIWNGHLDGLHGDKCGVDIVIIGASRSVCDLCDDYETEYIAGDKYPWPNTKYIMREIDALDCTKVKYNVFSSNVDTGVNHE